jgi:hypothetical protein
MPTLILSPRFSEDSIFLGHAAVQQKWSVQRLINWHLDGIEMNAPVAVYGEPLFVQYIAEQLALVALETPDDWLPSLPSRYTNRVIKIKRLGDLVDADFPAFLKSPNDKSFAAKVYAGFADFPAKAYLPPETSILLSEPVAWEMEFRCFVHQRKCVTFSIYARNGVVARDANGEWIASQEEQDGAIRFLEMFLSDSAVAIPRSIVIDIGLIAGRGWSVVEANGVWGAGIYGCEPEKVLRILADGLERAGE